MYVIYYNLPMLTDQLSANQSARNIRSMRSLKLVQDPSSNASNQASSINMLMGAVVKQHVPGAWLDEGFDIHGIAMSLLDEDYAIAPGQLLEHILLASERPGVGSNHGSPIPGGKRKAAIDGKCKGAIYTKVRCQLPLLN